MSFRSFAFALLALAAPGGLAGCEVAPAPPPDVTPDASGMMCRVDADCSDGAACTGTERCAPGTATADARGCVPDAAPPCLMGQRCDTALDRCVTECAVTEDADGDGSDAMECGGTDCDDSDNERAPGRPEICDVTDRDEDCDPLTFGVRDQDMDGEADGRCCNVADDGTRTCGRDCDDTSANVHPGQDESCNTLDDDCDTGVDEGVLVPFYPDADGDGFGDDSVTATLACEAAVGFSAQTGDCDDAVPAANPGAPEVCDAVDNDCDGNVDEGTGAIYFADADGDGFGDASGGPTRACTRPTGYVDIGGDCDDASAASNPGATEVCDMLDNNCSGAVDEGLVQPLYPDADRDGVGDRSVSASTRCPGEGWVANGTDCDDASPAVRPGLSEICDGLDNDCSGVVDNGLLLLLYPDLDDDGDGDAAAAGAMLCPAPNLSSRRTDCNDMNRLVYGSAPELCDVLDNDCDTRIDESTAVVPWYVDDDGDGYGNPRLPAMLSCNPIAGRSQIPECDDNRADVFPGAMQLCDRVDNACTTDDGSGNAPARVSEDVDGDGHSAPGVSCMGGYPKDDCVDTNATIYGGATERCDRLDNDCSSGGGLVANEDADLDGHARTTHSCRGGYPNDDCDDTRAGTYTGAPEVCDGRDNDCSSGGGLLPAEDADGDLHSAPAAACTGGYPRDDCDDTRATVYTGAPELCDRVDNDCSAGGVAVPAEDADMDGYGATTAPCAAGPRSDCDDTMAALAACMPTSTMLPIANSSSALVGPLDAAAGEELWSLAGGDVMRSMGGVPTTVSTRHAGAVAAGRGDFDGDGALEIALIEGTTLRWVENLDAAGSNTIATGVSGTAGNYLVIEEFNRDAYDDVIIVQATNMTIYLSNGTGGWQAGRTLNIAAAAINVWRDGLCGVAAADIRGVGYADLVVARVDGALMDSALDIVRNDGTGTVWAWGTGFFGWSTECSVGHVAVGDIDGDADLDIVHDWGASGLGGLYLYRNNGATGWAARVQIESRISGRLVLTDLDRDGDLDVVAGDSNGSATNPLNWYSNANGLGSTWTRYRLDNQALGDTYRGDIAVGDANGDGIWDLTVADEVVQWIQLRGGRFGEFSGTCTCWSPG